MTDLMPDHTGQLPFGIRQGQKAARHVDIASRQREGVRLRHIDDMKLERDVLARRMFGETLAELIEKRGEARIVSKAHARFDLLGFFIAEFLL